MALVMLIILIIIVFSIPSVQTWTAKKVTTALNEKLGTGFNIDRMGLNWKGQIDIREVFIADHHQDTLIYSKELQTSIRSFTALIQGKIRFGDIYLNQARLYITTYEGEEDDSISIFADKLDGDQDHEPETPFSLLGRSANMTDSRIRIVDYNREDPEIIVFDGIDLKSRNFRIIGPDVGADIRSLSFIMDRNLEVKTMSSDFLYTPRGMTFKKLNLKTDQSTLQGTVTLDAKNGMADFVNQVVITADLEDSKVSTHDLRFFYDEFGTDQTIFLDVRLHGTLNDFLAENIRLSMENTRISGNFTFKNIFENQDQFAISASGHRIATNYYDLRRLLPGLLGNSLPQELKELGNFTLTGTSSIVGEELNTNSVLASGLGAAKVVLKLGNLHDIDNAYYSGNVVLTSFRLRKLAGNPAVGSISGNLNVEGRGFTQETVNTQVLGKISSLGFDGYSYQNISISGNFKHPLFNGELSVDDPNLIMDFTGIVDASEDRKKWDFRTEVEFAELNRLNLVTRDSIAVFAGNVVVDMEGNTIDDVVGTINFGQTFYQNERDDYYFDDFTITSSFTDRIRSIEINSPDIITGFIAGEFLLEDIPALFQNGVASIYANYKPKEVTHNQYVDYDFEIYSKIVDVFVPQLKLGMNTKVRGSVYSDISKFKLDFRSPEILLFKNYVGDLKIQMDNDNPLFNTFISADTIGIGFYGLHELNMINKTMNDTMYIRTEFKGGKQKQDEFNLNLYHTINPEGKSVIGMKKSEITYNDNVWFLNENNNRLNKVVFDDNFQELRIDSLVLSHQQELIQMAGVLRDSTYKDLKLQFTDVNIGHIIPEIDSLEMNGNLNGKLDFLQKDGAYFPNSSITIDDLIVNSIPFGDLDLDIKGNVDLTNYDVDISLLNKGIKSINAIGRIDASSKNPLLQLDVDLNEFNIAAFSPFGEDVISDIRGLVSGNAIVSGYLKSPVVRGRFNLNQAGLKIPYLNTDFELEDNAEIIATERELSIGEVRLTDSKFGSSGILSGRATHRHFRDWELDLQIAANDRLLVLDTPIEEDALYYGTAFVSGLITFEGPIEQLLIRAAATTEPGTSFKIPISETESISDDSFVHFLSPREKEARLGGSIEMPAEIEKLTLEFDLNINKNAEVEVVVDQVNNSMLKGRGNGTLLLRIDTTGKFQMFGDFVVFEGFFDFRYGGIIQRTIEVVPGGTIVWDGAPEQAILDLSALYHTEANPSVLLDNPSVNRQIPVDVYVDLNDRLEQPGLNFRIEFPRVSSTLKSELQFKLQTEEQRQNQALFLLASNSFVNDNYEGTNAFAGTVADRVSGLVNSLFADQDSRFKVGLDYTVGTSTPDYETADRLGITLSTQISERILINGKVGVPVGGVTDNTVAGDVEIQWLMNEDGSLRMKFFNRQADLQFIGEDYIFEQGIGISYSVDFNTFNELMRKLFVWKGLSDNKEPENHSMSGSGNNQGIRPEELE